MAENLYSDLQREINDLHKELASSSRVPARPALTDMQHAERLHRKADASYKETLKPLLEGLLQILLTGGENDRLKAAASFVAMLPSSLYCWRGRQKPLGYAGDHIMMDFIYKFTSRAYDLSLHTSLLGWALDRFCISACSDVAERPAYLARTIRDIQLGEPQTSVNVLSIACGPLAELGHYLEHFHESVKDEKLNIWGLDNDQHALDFVQKQYKQFLQGNTDMATLSDEKSVLLKLLKANAVVETRPGRLSQISKELPQQHLIYSVGLMDYLEDKYLIQIADWAFDKLQPGGEMIFGNFAQDHNLQFIEGVRDFMVQIEEWELIHRTEGHLCSLIRLSKFGAAGARPHIDHGSTGLQLYVRVRKPHKCTTLRSNL